MGWIGEVQERFKWLLIIVYYTEDDILLALFLGVYSVFS